mmetsp:Transcript_21433/g.63967  ORF Transcript_21433/g.63967 Transcript_21433/m.63967 type:complete len:243 (-) Transcript_21433:220-948(-)
MKASLERMCSRALDRLEDSLSSWALVVGNSVSMTCLYPFVCCRCVRHSLASLGMVIFSFGATRSTSRSHSLGSTLASRTWWSSALSSCFLSSSSWYIRSSSSPSPGMSSSPTDWISASLSTSASSARTSSGYVGTPYSKPVLRSTSRYIVLSSRQTLSPDPGFSFPGTALTWMPWSLRMTSMFVMTVLGSSNSSQLACRRSSSRPHTTSEVKYLNCWAGLGAGYTKYVRAMGFSSLVQNFVS